MSWTRPAALRAQVQKLWERGDLLASVVTGEPLFPRRLTLRGPSSQEMTDRFDEVRAWIGELRGNAALPGRDARVPAPPVRRQRRAAGSVDRYPRRRPGADRQAARGQPLRRPARTDARMRSRNCWPGWRKGRCARSNWPTNGADCSTSSPGCRRHPRPGVYLRQVDIPGVHSKFIEAQRGVLGELLDLALPPAAIDSSAAGVSQFARRYGFRDKPQRIRFRILDRRHALLPGDPEQDLTLDARSFARIDPQVERVFITENEINFLAFPAVPHSLILFGAGYGFEMLREAAWLSRCRIHYWGDIDTHGFAILDQLRAHFADVESFLMDRATLLAFERNGARRTGRRCASCHD
jgi:hypothetical protein